MADICLLSTVDFAGWIGLPLEDEFENLKAWHARATARPSADAYVVREAAEGPVGGHPGRLADHQQGRQAEDRDDRLDQIAPRMGLQRLPALGGREAVEAGQQAQTTNTAS